MSHLRPVLSVSVMGRLIAPDSGGILTTSTARHPLRQSGSTRRWNKKKTDDAMITATTTSALGRRATKSGWDLRKRQDHRPVVDPGSEYGPVAGQD